MRNVKNILPTASLLAAILSTSLSTGADAQLQDKLYGAGSGTTGGALAIDLVERKGEPAVIRLSGGVQGDVAELIVGTDKDTKAVNGATKLVDGAVKYTITFGQDGAAEFALDQKRGTTRYFQGIHTSRPGSVQPQDTVRRYSAGLKVTRDQRDPTTVADLATFHLPTIEIEDVLRDAWKNDLHAALSRSLNSAGDVLKLEFGGNAQKGGGKKIGAKGTLRAWASRTEENGKRYWELMIGAEAAGTVGVDLSDRVSAESSGGSGLRVIYRFDSVSDLMRGVRAVLVTSLFGAIDPAKVSTLTKGYDKAVDAAEKALDAAEKLVGKSEGESKLTRGKAWRDLYAKRLEVIDPLEAAVKTAKRALNAFTDAIDDLSADRRFIDKRRHAFEVNFKSEAEVAASLGIPGLDLANVGVGASVTLKRDFIARFGIAPTGPRPVTVIAYFETKGVVEGGFGVGLDATGKRSVELAATATFNGGQFVRLDSMTATLGRDLGLRAKAGAGAAVAAGVGRNLAVTLDLLGVASACHELGRYLGAKNDNDRQAALARLTGAPLLSVAVTDRYEGGIEVQVGVDAAGTGGGIEGELTWVDQGDAATLDLTPAVALALIAQNPVTTSMANAHGKVEDALKDAKQWLKDKRKALADSIKDAAKDLLDKAKATAVRIAQNAYEAASGAAKTVGGAMKTGAQKTKDGVSKGAKKVSDGAKKGAKKVGDGVKKIFS